MSDVLKPGDKVQVFNHGPLAKGILLAAPERRYTYRWVRVRWDSGGESSVRLDLLRRRDS